ncbi:hypothetical protein [Streptomyces stelliscabiei]|uniref:ATP-dependent exoDNAse (Exonuclease V) beta subunit n=1 Tax=Streptomyces stelliscabiei TaxID=146820 RepID=A0A8I0PI06_9ACTN|nr:hypothetical protein [Streptomyces stelliscabiei]MBE1602896.1 ATP-dependent exoDNAse (exonuclease V) beta subunit [Streptomyces stelliscabiei]MDX2522569.1 hypothetical protein [Streptomyces stelliscabiei]
MDDTGRAVPGQIDDGEARLAYVAVTRTRHRLDIGGLSWIDDHPAASLTCTKGPGNWRRAHIRTDASYASPPPLPSAETEEAVIRKRQDISALIPRRSAQLNDSRNRRTSLRRSGSRTS